jgi:4-aminobutyrate aminotransferase-like enzyme
LGLVNDTSDFLKIELNRVKAERGLIANVRGQGTFLGFDVVSREIADNL